MRVEKDYEELLRLFNKNKVRYCVVGAYAVAFYGIPRYTKDMDILVEPDLKNGEKIINALRKFGFKNLQLSAEDFSKRGRIIQLGYEPLRVDIITFIEGCSFEEVWENRERGTYGKEKIFFIGLKELIKNKKVSNRRQDKIDLQILRQVAKNKK